MDVLKLVPQVFFDLIARAVPGAFLLICLQASANKRMMPTLLALAAPNAKLQESALVWAIVVGSAVFATGHMMAPAVRFLESPPVATSVDIWARMVNKLLPFRTRHQRLPKERWEQYDWLRLERPETGALVVRIRAEYTMYGGFAVALLLTTAVLLARVLAENALSRGDRLELFLVASGALFLGVVMHKRQLDTYMTFGLSVQNFHKAAAERVGRQP